MGVKITELLPKEELDISKLHGKVLAIDASLFLYQFLSSIRQRDGSLLTDSKGRVTSHLVGLFTRTAKLIGWGIRPVYVFDGKAPDLKRSERERRSELKKDAEAKYKIAVEKEDTEGMKKFASRTSKLTSEMVAEAKDLLRAMGVAVVEAPSEGEAQAAHLVKKGDAYAVASQDSDSLLFGAPRLVRNLSAYGKRKISNKLAFETVQLELIELDKTLKELDISHAQFTALCMLIGTDYNVGGVKGIGPKNGLKLVKQYKEDFAALFDSITWEHEHTWQTIFEAFGTIPVTDDYSLVPPKPNKDELIRILVEEHDFSVERVTNTLDKIAKDSKARSQMTLGQF